MAGNNSIQFLRGTSAQRATHTETSLAGQPIYETDTNRLYVGDGVTAVNALRPVNSISDYWEAVEQGFITPAIGDTKTISISGSNYQVRCIGINHDDLADGSGKARTTWEMVDCLSQTYQMNTSATNIGGWKDSYMRNTILSSTGAIFTSLPSDLKPYIKTVIKKTADGGDTNYSGIIETEDKLFLLSAVEVLGTTISYGGSSPLAYTGEGYQYELYSGAPIPEPVSGTGQFTPLKEHSSTGTFYTTDTSVAQGYIDKYGDEVDTQTNRRYNYNSVKYDSKKILSSVWWLRSPYRTTAYAFCQIKHDGFLENYLANSNTKLSFCFCV